MNTESCARVAYASVLSCFLGAVSAYAREHLRRSLPAQYRVYASIIYGLFVTRWMARIAGELQHVLASRHHTASTRLTVLLWLLQGLMITAGYMAWCHTG
jgi:hypothetical protein